MSRGSGDSVTHFLEEEVYQDYRRLVYDNTGIVLGSFTVAFNLFVIISFFVSKFGKVGSLSRRISFSLIALSVFSCFHGFMFAAVYPYQRANRRTMEEEMCMLTTLVLDFCDHFMLILLVLVAIERFIIVFFTSLSKKKRTSIVVVLFIFDFIAAIFIAWLPLVPGLALTEPGYQSSAISERVSSFQLAFTCNLKLNKRNWISPYLLLSVQVICSVGVATLMILNQWRIRKTVEQTNSLGNEEKEFLKRGAINTGIISAVIIILTLPYAVNEVIRSDCDILYNTDSTQNNCSAWGLELRFVFRIFFHASDFFGPFLFTMLDPKIRSDFRYFILKAVTCGKYQGKSKVEVGPETGLQTETEWANETKLSES